MEPYPGGCGNSLFGRTMVEFTVESIENALKMKRLN